MTFHDLAEDDLFRFVVAMVHNSDVYKKVSDNKAIPVMFESGCTWRNYSKPEITQVNKYATVRRVKIEVQVVEID